MSISLYPILIITMLLLLFLFIEYRRHQKVLKTIPIRIHVNGTRGKSSVTRLIGAGLRAGGLKTITKVTGTFPRLVLSDGTEVGIHRKEKANILEQLNIVKFCANQKADVLLIECMALQPQYQRITERQMIKSTIGVITNIRLDHLDVMGPTLDHVAKAISGTIPYRSHLFTGEDRYLSFCKEIAQKKQTQLHNSSEEPVSDEDMIGFRYLEHKANVALALNICRHFKIDRQRALEEMKKTIPDEGVLTKSVVKENDTEIFFYNAFAANDPESSLMIWNSVMASEDLSCRQAIVLINTRKDREDRARQLVEMASQKLHYDMVVLMGESCEIVKAMAIKNNIPENKIVLIGKKTTEETFNHLLSAVQKKAIVVGVGNMGAGGAELVKYFEKQSK
jgi:gamma-polyglutamate synthase